MSGKQSGLVWELVLTDSKGVSKEAKQIVLLAMADHADHEGESVYPSIGLLAWKTGKSTRQIVRVIKQLMIEELVRLEQKTFGKWRTRLYSLHLENGIHKQKYEGRKSLKPTPVTRGVIPPCDIVVSHPPVTLACHPNHQLEPSVKPSDKIAQNQDELKVPVPRKIDVPDNLPIRCEICGELVEWGDESHPCGKESESRTEPIRTRKVFEPKTELALYLRENTEWRGFSSSRERKDWQALESQDRLRLKKSIDWALTKQEIPIKYLAGRIMAAYKTFAVSKPSKPQESRQIATMEEVKRNMETK